MNVSEARAYFHQFYNTGKMYTNPRMHSIPLLHIHERLEEMNSVLTDIRDLLKGGADEDPADIDRSLID